MRTLANHVLGDNRSAVVLVAQHDDVHVEVPGALDDDVSGVVLGGLDKLAVHLDPRAGQLVNGVLDDLPLPDVDVLRRRHADVGADADLRRNRFARAPRAAGTPSRPSSARTWRCGSGSRRASRVRRRSPLESGRTSSAPLHATRVHCAQPAQIQYDAATSSPASFRRVGSSGPDGRTVLSPLWCPTPPVEEMAMTMQTPVVGVLSPGDMGRSIGMVLQAHGLRTLTCLAGRGERTRALAADAGFEDTASLAELVHAGRHPAVRTCPGPCGRGRRRGCGRGPRYRCRIALRRLQRGVPADRTGDRSDPRGCRSAVRRRRDRRSAAGGDWVHRLGDPLLCVRFRFGGARRAGVIRARCPDRRSRGGPGLRVENVLRRPDQGAAGAGYRAAGGGGDARPGGDHCGRSRRRVSPSCSGGCGGWSPRCHPRRTAGWGR